MVQKDSTSLPMCAYNQDMIQVQNMETETVSIRVNNVWSNSVTPNQMRVFIHSNGVNSILPRGDGFQCLNDYGSDIDLSSFTDIAVQCYQDEAEGPWLAAIDVVITDNVIDGQNDVDHPCSEGYGPIEKSCSWRIVVPCTQDQLCTDEPTGAPSGVPTTTPSAVPSAAPTDVPTGTPSATPSVVPTGTPSSTPTVVPTGTPSATSSVVPTGTPSAPPTVASSATPTAVPTTKAPITTTGRIPKPTFSPTFPPFSENTNICIGDILLIKTEGVTELPKNSVTILQQSTSNVTVQVSQKYTPDATIDSVFYKYQKTVFDSKCYQEDDFKDPIDITIQCTHESKIAELELWMVDALDHGIFESGDNSTVPKCCHRDKENLITGIPVVKYVIEIKCVTECPEVESR